MTKTATPRKLHLQLLDLKKQGLTKHHLRDRMMNLRKLRGMQGDRPSEIAMEISDWRQAITKVYGKRVAEWVFK